MTDVAGPRFLSATTCGSSQTRAATSLSLSRPTLSNNSLGWTDGMLAILRQLWDEGLPTSAIGDRIGVSKNSVIGKAHRLNLPKRMAFSRKVKRTPEEAAAIAARNLENKRRSLRMKRLREREKRRAEAEKARIAKKCPARQAEVKLAKPLPQKARLQPSHSGEVIECHWPEGEPGFPDFRFCCEPSHPGKPYCLKHCRVAYASWHVKEGEKVNA